MKKWLSVKEAAEYVGYAPKSLDNLRGQGKGPRFVRTGSGSIRYLAEWLDEWIEGKAEKRDDLADDAGDSNVSKRKS